MLTAFRQELAEAGYDSLAELTRFHLHLDESTLESFVGRVKSLVEEYLADDAERHAQGAPGYGGMVIVHRLAEETPEE